MTPAAPVQQNAEPAAADAPARTGDDAQTARWMDVAMRPDTHDAPVQRKEVGGDPGRAPSSPEPEIFTVPKGWGLNQIAQHLGVSVDAIKDANRDKLHQWNGVAGFYADEQIVVPRAEPGEIGRQPSRGDAREAGDPARAGRGGGQSITSPTGDQSAAGEDAPSAAQQMWNGAVAAVSDTASDAWDAVGGGVAGGFNKLVSVISGAFGNESSGRGGDALLGRTAGLGSGADLSRLMAKDRLTPEEIARARALIERLPAEAQAEQWLALQSKTEYQNQRDNAGPDEGKDGGTCNLTSVAMCLEYLGIPNPHPELQYDEALVKIANDNNFGELVNHSTWRKVVSTLGVQMTEIPGGGSKVPKATWTNTVRDVHLAAGHSVLCSISGHIVRVQAVTETGVVVDDPYGASILNGKKYGFDAQNAGKEGWDADNESNEGEDHAWPWDDVLAHKFGLLYAFSR